MHVVEDDDARYLASLASQVLGIQRSQAERLAEAYVRELPGRDASDSCDWIETARPDQIGR
jgi:hypothetical protein